MSKINPTPIIRDHLSTLTRREASNISVLDLLLFYGVPGAAVIGWREAGWQLAGDVTGVLVTGLALLTGLLLNLLLLIHGVGRGQRLQGGLDLGKPRKLLAEVYRNISYGILVGVVALITLVLQTGGWLSKWGVLEGAAVYLLVHFFLTLLMILKRIHVLLSHEFSAGQG